ncbi:cellulase-domain-containing protein [Paraphaeosphaeria sporulosa]|uniref:Endoglucanase EG-II n=1 Tax=Paraphaeosphaeria sporulosa TaxID=1460663 RepID=A0A177CUW1_9PLEO|nr:cellulase-domain-containing protein [Paraphaeosphaeria sporulosa]OAG10577.1 cellulase-domain-containing protein [Paraphaeosphaeria sporulosa]
MARYSFAFTALAATGAAAAAAQGTAYAQCGGQGWTGATTCVSGYHCQFQNDWYSQCIPGAASAAVSSAAAKTTLVTLVRTSAAAKTSSAAKTSVAKTTAVVAKTTAVVAAASSTVSTAKAAAATSSSGKTQYAGVNIAGFDFGCYTDGSCGGSYSDPGANGIAQMKHFATDDKLNVFRLPIGWQHLLNNVLGGSIDATVGAAYDKLVQGCLATGALCVIDLHNYARWNGAIVGQGGPTDAQFADVWSKLATKYASQKNIAFGLMNEPHDLTMSTWATSVQAAVTAIRKAGATSQMILLPGTDYTSAGTFVANSGPALLKVTDSDGTTSKLIFDVHRYLDSDNSGTNAECVTDHVADTFVPLATWLRTNKRQAILSEVGGGNTASCQTDVCAAIASLNQNSDVYLGYIGWSAGAFDTSYVLSLTPNGSADQALLTKCFSRA